MRCLAVSEKAINIILFNTIIELKYSYFYHIMNVVIKS